MPVLVDAVNEPVYATGPVIAATTSTTQGASNDFSDGCEPMGLLVTPIAFTGVTTAYVQAEESTTGTGAWTAIANMVISFTTTPSLTTVATARGLRSNQYVRINFVTLTGTTTPAVTMGTVLLQQRKYIAVSKSGADRSPST
jgi:hypothetical protein